MTSSWPSQCPPAPLFRQQSDAPANNLLRTEMDQGPAKARRRSTAAPEPISSTFTMSGSQWLVLRDWYVNELKDGTQPFLWKHPTTGVAGTFRFTAPPSAVPSKPMAGGGRFRVTVSLELMP